MKTILLHGILLILTLLASCKQTEKRSSTETKVSLDNNLLANDDLTGFEWIREPQSFSLKKWQA